MLEPKATKVGSLVASALARRLLRLSVRTTRAITFGEFKLVKYPGWRAHVLPGWSESFRLLDE